MCPHTTIMTSAALSQVAAVTSALDYILDKNIK